MESLNLLLTKLYTVICFPQCEKTLKILVMTPQQSTGLYVAGLEGLDVPHAQKQ